MFPATSHHPSPPSTITLHHTPPQNHLSAPEYHLLQNLQNIHPTHSVHQLHDHQIQNHPSKADLAFFLQKMAENHAKHQEQTTQLIHSCFSASTISQHHPSPVQDSSAAVYADSEVNRQILGSFPVHCATAGSGSSMAGQQVSCNLPCLPPSSLPLLVASSHFSSSEPRLLSHFPCKNSALAGS